MNKLLEPIENSSWVYFLKMDGQFNVNTTQKTITIRPKSDKIRKGSLIRYAGKPHRYVFGIFPESALFRQHRAPPNESFVSVPDQ